MDIEKESSRNRRRVSFVPVDINQQEESIHDVSVIQKEKEELLGNILYNLFIEGEEENYKKGTHKIIFPFPNRIRTVVLGC